MNFSGLVSNTARCFFGALVYLTLTSCAQIVLLPANAPAWFGHYSRDTDIAYGQLPAQRLDLYKPTVARAAAPVVIFIHGGGWNSGDKNLYRFVGAALAEQNWISVSINYRLYPTGKFPALMQDAAMAVKYVHDHASEWGGDPNRIYLLGHSAGAHIAVMLALDNEYLQQVGGDSHWLRGVIGLAGPYDFIPFKYDYMNDLFGPEANYPRSQPINFARADAPPLLLLHGLADTVALPRNTINLVAAMQQHGGKVQSRYYEKVDHFDIVAAFSKPARGVAPVLSDIKKFIDDENVKFNSK
jgi:acetyl esterase/lipase